MPPTQFYNLVEVEEQARQVMEKQSYDYISGGSGSLYTINENLASFSRLKLVPRLLRDVSRVDMSCNILGVQSSMPVWIAPMAMHGLCHPDREMGTARAAAAAGVPYTFSTVATSSMQEIASTGHPNPVFQLYVIRDRGVVEAWVCTAEKLGFKALMVTVDAQRLGYREADERNRFTLPAHLQLKNLELLRNRTRTSQARDSEAGSGLTQLFAKEVDDTLTWDFVPWLRSITRLPIIVKGLLAAEDVELALAAGVNGIAVSNHGGRQLDCSPSALEVLPAIVKAVNKRVPVFMDGGIRRGTDVLKALALGADCVLLGRPVLYGLALAGQEGVGRVISLLRNELELSMALAGCPSLAHISPHLILPPQPHPRDLLLGPATHTNNPTGSSSGGSSSSTGMQRASCAAHTDSPVCSSSSSSGSSSTGVQRADCAACTSGSACSTCSCSGGSRSTMGMGGPGVAAISRNSTSQLGGGFGGACGGSRAVCCECECSNSCGGGGSGAQTLMGQGRGVASRL